MKLTRLRIRNFRCYCEEFVLDLDNLTVLVGKNDIGKSAILEALGIFFDEVKIDSDDGCVRGDKKNVCIICEFEDLPSELVIDTDYPTSLEKEFLINRDGRLEIHKVFDVEAKTPKLLRTCAYALHPSAQDRNDLLQLKNAELKERIHKLNIDTHDVDLKVNTQIRRRIWETTDDLQLQYKEIPLEIETTKKIWDQLKLNLPNFALFKSDRSSTDQDSEAQDPMKMAVKEALKEKEAELNAISEYVENEVKLIAGQTLNKLKEMNKDLASELNPVFTTPNWANVFKISLTNEETIPLNKRGSGVRRLVLLNFFRAKAEQSSFSKGSPSLIYAIEEPETSLHPNNQIMLINAFKDLAEDPCYQIIITTHNPTLARLVPAESLRFISCEEANQRTVLPNTDDTYKKIAKALGVLPDHGVKLFIGVEGSNDINFLKNISQVLNKSGEDVVDLVELEESGEVIFFPLGGNNLILWESRLAKLNRPEFYIFDRDEQPPKESIHKKTVDEINMRQGCKAFLTSKREMENYIHPEAIKHVCPDLSLLFNDFDDVPYLVAQSIHALSDSPYSWEELTVSKKEERVSKAKKLLNQEATKAMTPEMLTDIDRNLEVRSWLTEIKQMITND